jgi:hypothetical protein
MKEAEQEKAKNQKEEDVDEATENLKEVNKQKKTFTCHAGCEHECLD